jgi:hypothetical protein
MVKIRWLLRLFILIILHFCIFNSAFCQNSKPILNEIDLQDISSFHLLDSSINKYSVFLSGELHDHDGDYNLQLNLLKYLNKKSGLKKIVFEQPVSYELIFNQYINTGDSSLLEKILLDFDSTMEKKSRFFYKSLFEFNKGLPDTGKISIICVDIEKNIQLSIKNIYSFSNQKIPFEIYLPLIKLLLLAEKGSFHRAQTIRKATKLLRDMNQNKSYYMEYYKDNFLLAKRTFEGIILGCEFFEKDISKLDTAFWAKRELYMYRNFTNALNVSNDKRAFGLFGLFHVCILPNANWFDVKKANVLGSYLATDSNSPVKD